MSLLQELRARGNRIRRGEGDRLYLGGLQNSELVALVRSRKLELLEELRREEAEATRFYACPVCGNFDYQPLGDGRRWCLNYDCRRVYRNADELCSVAPMQTVQACHFHRDTEGEVIVNAYGPGCGLHLRVLDAAGRCPVNGQVVNA